jgi:hypothetical protein
VRRSLWHVGWLGLLALAGSAAAVRGQSVEASLDRSQISLEEEAVLRVTVEGSRRAQPRLPDLANVEVRQHRQSSQVEFVNGKISRRVIHSWVLRPLTTGDLTIGPVEVELEGTLHTTRPLVLRVTAAPDRSGEPRSVFVTAEVSDRRPFVGEQVVFVWRFFRAVRTGRASLESQDLGSFLAEDLGDVRQFETTVDGVRYEVSEIRKAIFAPRPGPAIVPPWSMKVQVVVEGRRSASSFDSFFRRARTEQRVLRTDAIELDVRPLPGPVPDNFSGLIGDFDVTMSVSAVQAHVGESITQTVVVSGAGNAQLIGAPTLPTPTDFKVYDDQPELTVDRSGSRLEGRKTFTRALVPLAPGPTRLDAVDLLVFDPEAEVFTSVVAPALALDVLPSTGAEELRLTESLGSSSGKVAVRILGNDIMPIHRDLDALTPPFWQRAGSDWWLLSPVAGFALLFFVQGRRLRLAGDSGLRRRHEARRTARKALRASGEDPAELSRAVRTYLGNKLNVEGAALTPLECRRALDSAAVPEELAADLEKWLERAEAAHYGSRDEAAPVSAAEAAELLERLEGALGRRRL